MIKDLHIHILDVPMGGRLYNPRIVWTRKQSVFLRVVDGDGCEGWGECWCFDTSADALVRFLQTEIRPRVIGQDVASIADLWREVYAITSLNGRHGMTAAALSGLDIALHDLAARRQGVPLGATLGQTNLRHQIPVYASGGLYHKEDSPERLAGEMSDLVSHGHRRVKMKIGALSFEQDVERVQAVRAAIGPDVGLIVDAVYSLDRAKATRWLPVWKNAGVEAVQAPFPCEDWEDMRWLNRDCGMPVMVFEAESRFEIFRSLLEYGAIGLLQFSAIAVGGVTAARKLIDLASRHQTPVTLQCSSTWLAEAVSLELARAYGTVSHVELHTVHQGLFDLVPMSARCPEGGMLTLGDHPGLGFTPRLDQLNCVDDGLPDMAVVGMDQQVIGGGAQPVI